MSKPSITNCPNTFFRKFIVSTVCTVWMVLKVVIQQSTFNITYAFACVQIRHNPLSGGYCSEVPPLPIPNREVKLTCADGTAMQCGRVGSRLLLSRASDFERFLRLFCFHAESFFFSRLLFFRSRRFRRWRRFLTCSVWYFSIMSAASFTFLPFYFFTFISVLDFVNVYRFKIKKADQ